MAADLPEGDGVTFLFSDIEGSTWLLQQLGDRFPDVVLEHRRLLRSVWETYGGTELGTEGDSFTVVFSDAAQAIGAALAGQRSLRTHTWDEDAPIRVRMGLHTGPARVVADDYFGMTIHQAARLASAAHGGQTVVSDSTCLAAGPVPGVKYEDLGLHRLKDLASPLHVFQLVAPGLERDFPPIRSLAVWPNNFPVQPTTFIGRQEDIEGVRSALTSSSVVTITGPGGVGKTRLALQVGADLVDSHGDGSWLVQLAPLSRPELVAGAIMGVLGVREQSGRDPIDTLVDSLIAKRLLIVLDNCEHLIDACADVIDRVVSQCAGVKVLATSRESLQVAGERVWRLRPMEVPKGAGLGAKDLQEVEAVQLFVDRATAYRHDFSVTEEAWLVIGEICQLLDGLPLALELAAARVRSLSVSEIAAGLSDRFRLLTSRSRAAPAHHRTLERTVAWSYDLLTETDQALFDRLAVFADGATIDAIKAVCTEGALEGHDVLDRVDSLVDRSLVVADQPDSSPTRYRQLDTIREYAWNNLATSDDFDSVVSSFVRWALTLATSAPPQAGEPLPPDLAAEEVNLRHATEQAINSDDHEAALRLTGAVWAGHFAERERLYGQLLPPKPGTAADVAGSALFAGGALAFMMAEWDLGSDRLSRAVEANREAGNRFLVSMSLTYLATCEWGRGDEGSARRHLNQALTEAREIGDAVATARAKGILAWLDSTHNPDRSEQLALEGIELSRGFPDVFDLAHFLEALAFVRSRRDGPSAGSADLAAALELFRSVPKNCQAHILETTAAWSAMKGDFELGAELLGSARRVRQETHDRPRPWEERVLENVLPAINSALPREVIEAAQDRGRGRDASEALSMAADVVAAGQTMLAADE